nr:unnamed protein product [Spirometra erinaceieuropaei]
MIATSSDQTKVVADGGEGIHAPLQAPFRGGVEGAVVNEEKFVDGSCGYTRLALHPPVVEEVTVRSISDTDPGAFVTPGSPIEVRNVAPKVVWICFTTLHPSTLAACVYPRQTSVLAVPLQLTHPLELPVRFKSKGQSKVKHESAPVKAENLSEEIRSTLHEAEMEKEFARILDRFQDDLFLKLCLKLTPEHFFNLPIPGERLASTNQSEKGQR